IELGYPSRLAFIGKDSQQDTMTALPAERRKLNAAADKIARSSAQRIVFHKAWQQRLEPIDNAASVVIHGGKTHGPHYELEGSVKFSRNRYLHITTDLWLSRFGPQAIGSDQAWPPLPPIPQRNGRRSSSGDYASIRAAQATRIVKMEEYRRMRSDEIHYLDHPLFGLLVTISKAEFGDNEADINDDEVADATAQNP
ncbi:hypothetical protein GYB62_00910, partial [bacterium]|nr:hypothetical protein [bacterium]